MEMTTATAEATQVYQLYIRASADQVWKAITDPVYIARFHFGAQTDPSDFAIGSRIKSWSPDRTTLWTDNQVLEYDPPRRLAHTWRSLYDPEAAPEPESRVSWEVEPMPGGFARLTVIHDRLENSPITADHVRGWSYVVSNLKTLLETGESLPPVAL
jgi:uncharacterized protein YndB with AHSA1/START domain